MVWLWNVPWLSKPPATVGCMAGMLRGVHPTAMPNLHAALPQIPASGCPPRSELDGLKMRQEGDLKKRARHAISRLSELRSERDTWVLLQSVAEHHAASAGCALCMCVMQSGAPAPRHRGRSFAALWGSSLQPSAVLHVQVVESAPVKEGADDIILQTAVLYQSTYVVVSSLGAALPPI